MKNTIVGLALVLFTSACSHKTETTPASSISDLTPQFAIATGDVTNISLEVVTGRVPASPTQEVSVVHLELLGKKASEFRQFTKDHVHQKVQILVGTKVVETPVIEAEIPSPKIELMFSSPDEARSVADLLGKK